MGGDKVDEAELDPTGLDKNIARWPRFVLAFRECEFRGPAPSTNI